MRSGKSFGGPVKHGFFTCLPVLRSGKGPKVFPMSVVPLIFTRVPLISTRVSAHCQAILLPEAMMAQFTDADYMSHSASMKSHMYDRILF